MQNVETLQIYDWRTLTEVSNQLFPVPRFLWDMLIGEQGVTNHATQQITVDVLVNNRRIAPVTRRGNPYRNVTPTSYRQQGFTPPRLAAKIELRAEELYGRRYPGYVPFNPTARQVTDSAMDYVATQMRALSDQIERAKEYMLAQILFGRTSPATVSSAGIVFLTDGDGYDVTIDMQMPSAHKFALTATDRWVIGGAVNATAPIYGQLLNWSQLIQQASGYRPTDLVGSEQAIRALLQNETIQSLFDVNRYAAGSVSPSVVPNPATGATYHGSLLGLNVYSYNEYLQLPTGSSTVAMTPTYRVCLFSRYADFREHRAAIPDARAGLVMGRYSKMWVEEDPSAMFLSMEERSVVIAHNPGAMVTVEIGD